MKYILLTFLILIQSCSHQELVKDAHVPGSCADRIKQIKPPVGQQIVDISKQATSGTASIAVVGAANATDLLVMVITSPVTKVTLCLGLVAAVAFYGHGHGDGNIDICRLATGPGYDPKLGQGALKNTKSWRCPNLDYISEGLREVASCYSEKNENEKARLQLENILANKSISDCISKSEKKKIKQQINSLVIAI